MASKQPIDNKENKRKKTYSLHISKSFTCVTKELKDIQNQLKPFNFSNPKFFPPTLIIIN